MSEYTFIASCSSFLSLRDLSYIKHVDFYNKVAFERTDIYINSKTMSSLFHLKHDIRAYFDIYFFQEMENAPHHALIQIILNRAALRVYKIRPNGVAI